MNLKRIISTGNKWFVICGYSFVAAVFWTFVVVGVLRLTLKLEEDVAVSYIGIPLFVVLTVWFCRLLPKHLRKAGVLRDD